MKQAVIIRRVPFKTPGPKSRIVWANILVESQGLALLVVPKLDMKQPHSIYFATENVSERVFESVGDFRFDLETDDLCAAADRMKMLGKEFSYTDFANEMRHRRHDEF